MRTIRNSLMRHWPLFPAFALLLIVFVIPVVQLLWLSAVDDSGVPSLVNFVRLFETPLYLQVLGSTFRIAAWTTLVCLIVGYPIAFLLATTSIGWRGKLMIGVMMPFWTSVLVRTFAWTVILGRNGVINQWLQATGLTSAPIDMMFNMASVVVGMSHALMPMAVLTMLAVMQNIDTNLSRAAATLGANSAHRFWRIYFPLSMPGVAAAGLLTFITAIGFFITPTLLGSPKEAMLAQVIVVQIDEMLDWGFAGAVALLLLAAALIVFYIFDRVLGMEALTGQSKDRTNVRRRGNWSDCAKAIGRRVTAALAWSCGWFVDRLSSKSSKTKETPARPLLWIVGGAGILFLTVPSFFLVPMSFTSGTFLEWPPRGFSLQWYWAYFESPVWQEATMRSIGVGLATSALSVLIGIPAAFMLSRHQVPGKSAVMAFLLLPMIMPHIIVALALFYSFSHIGLVGTSVGLILGHTVFALPYVVITVMAVLRNYDTRLDQAAHTLGASKLVAFRRVTFPIIRTGVITAFIFAFVKSFDELTVALFISGGATTTLPKQMWADALLNVTPTLAAVSTLILLFVTVIILLTEALSNRKSVR